MNRAKFLFVLLSLLSLASCSKEPVTIGFIGPLTGKYSDLGVQGRNGLLIAVEEINAGGGIEGREIRVIIEDDKGDPSRAVEAFDRIADKIFVVIGPMTSSSAMAIKPKLDSSKTVAIAPTVSTSRLSGIKDYFFRVHPDLRVRTRHLAMFSIEFFKKEKDKRWCFIYDLSNWQFSEDFVENFLEVLTREGESNLTTDIKSLSWFTACKLGYFGGKEGVPLEVFQRLMEFKPKAVVLVTSALDSAYIVNWLNGIYPPPVVFTSDWASTSAFLQRLNVSNPKVFLTSLEPPQLSEEAKRFKKLYFDRFGKIPNFPAMQSYEAVYVFKEAFIRAKGKKEALPDALTTIKNLKGLLSSISINDFGDVERPCWIYTIKDGSLEPVSY